MLSGIIITATTFETLGISYVFPVADCDLKLTTANKGVLSGITSVGIIASAHIWGFLSDSRGRKSVIVPTLILSFIATVLSSLATSFTALVFFRFLAGFLWVTICSPLVWRVNEISMFSVAGSSSTIYAYLGEFHSRKNRSRVIMAASFVYGVSCNYMPALGFLLVNQTYRFSIPLLDIEYKPWRMYILCCGLPGFICAVILAFLPESPKFTFSKVWIFRVCFSVGCFLFL